jgi:hypothetical protein
MKEIFDPFEKLLKGDTKPLERLVRERIKPAEPPPVYERFSPPQQLGIQWQMATCKESKKAEPFNLARLWRAATHYDSLKKEQELALQGLSSRLTVLRNAIVQEPRNRSSQELFLYLCLLREVRFYFDNNLSPLPSFYKCGESYSFQYEYMNTLLLVACCFYGCLLDQKMPLLKKAERLGWAALLFAKLDEECQQALDAPQRYSQWLYRPIPQSISSTTATTKTRNVEEEESVTMKIFIQELGGARHVAARKLLCEVKKAEIEVLESIEAAKEFTPEEAYSEIYDVAGPRFSPIVCHYQQIQQLLEPKTDDLVTTLPYGLWNYARVMEYYSQAQGELLLAKADYSLFVPPAQVDLEAAKRALKRMHQLSELRKRKNPEEDDWWEGQKKLAIPTLNQLREKQQHDIEQFWNQLYYEVAKTYDINTLAVIDLDVIEPRSLVSGESFDDLLDTQWLELSKKEKQAVAGLDVLRNLSLEQQQQQQPLEELPIKRNNNNTDSFKMGELTEREKMLAWLTGWEDAKGQIILEVKTCQKLKKKLEETREELSLLKG